MAMYAVTGTLKVFIEANSPDEAISLANDYYVEVSDETHSFDCECEFDKAEEDDSQYDDDEEEFEDEEDAE